MTTCPKCKAVDCIKDGRVGGRQRYQCKGFGYRYTVAYKWYGDDVKQQVLKLLEGLGFHSIARVLNCSHVAVYKWIKQYGEKASLDLKAMEIAVLEMDEMHSYIERLLAV